MSKVKDAVAYVAKCLGMEELCEALSAGREPTDEALVQQKDLVRCLNLVVGDLVLGPVELVGTKVIAVTSGYVLYSRIDGNLLEVKALYDGDGGKVKFTPYSDRLLADDGVYTAEYVYLPKDLTMDDELPLPAYAGEKAVVCGTACEYCIACGRNNEAVKWENLFLKETEKIEKRKRSASVTMAYRRWY